MIKAIAREIWFQISLAWHMRHYTRRRKRHDRRKGIMIIKDYIKGFVNNDELLSHTFSGIPSDGGYHELQDGEEYELMLKMKHRKVKWVEGKEPGDPVMFVPKEQGSK